MSFHSLMAKADAVVIINSSNPHRSYFNNVKTQPFETLDDYFLLLSSIFNTAINASCRERVLRFILLYLFITFKSFNSLSLRELLYQIILFYI